MKGDDIVTNEKIKKQGKKGSLSGRNFKQGLFSSLVAVIVIAIVIIMNLFVGKLDLKIDLTEESVYTLTNETVQLAKNLNEDIDIFYIVKEDDEYEVLRNVIDQYDKLPHIKSTWKDPELYPQFTAKYTDAEVDGNDVVVVNRKTGASKFIPFNEMYIRDYSVNYTTGGYDQTYSLDAEGQITSAIQYVTTTEHQELYVVSAHGERALGDGVSALIKKANVDVVDFDVKSAKEVPDECSLLFINGPMSDISKEEYDMYKDYLDNGGSAILTVSYTEKDMTNYYALLEYYGVKASPGVIVESDGNYMNNYPSYAVAGFESVTDEMSANFTKNDYLVCPISLMLKLEDSASLRTSLKTSKIAISSDESYAKINPQPDTYKKEDGDPEGPFDLVIQATDSYKDKTAKVAIFATPYIFEDDWIDYYSCKNIDLLIDTIDWMNDKEQESVAIPQRSLDAVYLEVPQNSATFWAIITVFLIPVCILITGFVVWYFRRKH